MSFSKMRKKPFPGTAARIRAIRERLGLSSLEFARTLGVDSRCGWYWENEGAEPDITVLIALATCGTDDDAAFFVRLIRFRHARLLSQLEELQRLLRRYPTTPTAIKGTGRDTFSAAVKAGKARQVRNG
jgi:transcriptional regulator with XRE-family HTH domain